MCKSIREIDWEAKLFNNFTRVNSLEATTDMPRTWATTIILLLRLSYHLGCVDHFHLIFRLVNLAFWGINQGPREWRASIQVVLPQFLGVQCQLWHQVHVVYGKSFLEGLHILYQISSFTILCNIRMFVKMKYGFLISICCKLSSPLLKETNALNIPT